MNRRSWTGVAAALLLGLSVGGCGDSSDEEMLSRAEDLLRDAREAVRSARDDVQAKEEGVKSAESELTAARHVLQEAEEGLGQAESQVDLKATDALLFRAIQRKLLEDDRLERLAIRADVNKGVVTLRGSVPDAESRDTAIEVVQSFPGVVSVDSKLEVPAEAEQGS